LDGTMHLNLANGFTPHAGDPFRIIDNRGSNPINGTFAGLPEGATVWDSTYRYGFTISYMDGTGNDVVLTAKQTATTTAVTASAGSCRRCSRAAPTRSAARCRSSSN